jgi:transcriptional regulator with XRE-family HTH domain
MAKLCFMNDGTYDRLYRAFGKLTRQHREQREGMTQERLGRLIGLSRTSITNIEKGRQHVSLHQLFAIAEALRVRPDALLPSAGEADSASWLAGKLPLDTEPDITEWAEKLVGE